MANEQFSLCWDNFHKNMSSGMQSLLETEDLVDVTLAVEGKYLKAHKMVLSVCSPYFRELFQNNPCKHPIVFMKDVSYIALSDLLQFMYQGEVQVAQENLNMFIKTAEALRIKGLTGDSNCQDSDVSEPVEEEKLQTAKRPHETVSKLAPSTPRVKKLLGPASKRVKYTAKPEISNNTDVTLPQATVEKLDTSMPTLTAENDLMKFKLEPSESGNHLTEDDLQDDTAADNMHDDTEDYSLIEGVDNEPKAGPSTDSSGDNQDAKLLAVKELTPKKKRGGNRMRYVVNGFVYHNNLVAGNPPLRYLGCAELKRSGCRARATVRVDAPLSDLKLMYPHNHPPDVTAEEKQEFVMELKKAVRAMSHLTLKGVYEFVANLYPLGAKEISFVSIHSSLHRWRQNPEM